MAYQIPPEYEPREEQIPPYAHDIGRFRVCFALTRLIAQRDDPIFCKQLYDDPRLTTDDVELAEPQGPLPPPP
jgi:hypothetical protein